MISEKSMPKPPVRKIKKKVCAFCKDNAAPIDYKDTNLLRKFISDRGKIRAPGSPATAPSTSGTSQRP